MPAVHVQAHLQPARAHAQVAQHVQPSQHALVLPSTTMMVPHLRARHAITHVQLVQPV